MSEITKDQLEECGWEQATHTINPQGRIAYVEQNGNGSVNICNFCKDFTEWERLGFQPYRRKKDRIYTFMELRKEPGVYKMLESELSTVKVCADDCVQFLFNGIPQEVIANYRFDARYWKVSE